MNESKDFILQQIKNKYLKSNDFNGLPAYQIGVQNKKIILELFKENSIDVISSKFILNPHIKLFNLNVPEEEVIEEIENNYNEIVLYPSEKVLENETVNIKKPFTEELIKGKPQLEVVYFSVEILEEYYNNPKYDITFNGYKGNINLKEQYTNEDNYEYVRDFCMAYKKNNINKRAVGIILRDLTSLSETNQLKWYVKRIENQEDYKAEPDYIRNLLGDWASCYWIYDCLLEEMKLVNKMCDCMKLPHIFKKEYDIEDDEMRHYKTILLPTENNYNKFLMILEKLLVNNLNSNAFISKNPDFRNVENIKNEDGTQKATVKLFSEWLQLNISGNDRVQNDIIVPLKKIRKLRQKPAHDLQADVYDETIWEKQNNLIKEMYGTIRIIRLLFYNHPQAKLVKIPEYLYRGENIVTY